MGVFDYWGYVYVMDELSPKGIGYLLERTSRMVKLAYSQAFNKAGYDVTPEQWVVLESLFLQDGQTQNDLATDSFKDAPTISRILNLLEKKGYLYRRSRSHDKRIRFIFLSDSGRELVLTMQPEVQDLRSRGWAGLTSGDYEDFVRITNQIFANYEQ